MRIISLTLSFQTIPNNIVLRISLSVAPKHSVCSIFKRNVIVHYDQDLTG